jgi:cell wall-associated NlpC family hydrolase
MLRRIGIPSALALSLAALVAGCGGASEEKTARIHAWRADVLYLPPPAPQARTQRQEDKPPVPRGEQEAAPGAPTDAEVAAELKQAFKNSSGTGDIVDAASLTTADLATIPPSAPAKVAAMINAGNQVARKPYVYGGGHGGGPEGVFTDSA